MQLEAFGSAGYSVRRMRIPSRDTTFSVPRWIGSAHVQTLGAALPLWSPPRSFRETRTETLTLPLPAGGALNASAWWHPGEGRRRTVILVHGVGGSSESSYVLRAGVAMYRGGFHVVRLNLRGAGEGIWEAPTLYHAGLTEDLRAAILGLTRDRRIDGLVLVGFSLGGNATLKLAGEWGANPPAVVRSVATISAPLDLHETCRAMERLRNLPYRAYILRALVRQGQAFARIHPHKARYDARSLRLLTSIREYDEQVIAPMHGFANAADYYARSSAGPWLPSIEVPTLAIHADDDPMVPSALNTPWLHEASRAVHVLKSRTGGHVGWFSGVSEDRWINTWAIERVIDFARQ